MQLEVGQKIYAKGVKIAKGSKRKIIAQRQWGELNGICVAISVAEAASAFANAICS